MAEATQNGENLVKLSQKMVGKLRGFLKKVGDGLTTVPYIPGAVFEIAKLRKEEKQKTKVDTKEKASKNTKEEKTEPKKEMVENQKEEQTKTEPVISFGERVDQFVKKHVAESRKKKAATQSKVVEGYEEETAQKNTEDKKQSVQASEEVQPEKTKTIQGKSVADLLKDKEVEEVNEKENKPAQPETVEIETQVKPEPKKDKKEKKDLTDLTVFDSYEDYKYAFFWNYYINKKEFDSNQLDAFVKVLAKTADVKFYRTILTEGRFNAKKSEQEKEKEIDSIRKAEEEKNAKLDAERDAAIQKAKDDAQSTIDSLQDKLTDARSKNRVLTSKLKVNTEALASIGEISTTIGGIKAIDEAIAKANEKCQGIDERAEEREKSKEESKPKIESTKDLDVEAETDKIMKAINEKVYGPKEEPKTETKEEKVEEQKETEPVVASIAAQESDQKEETVAEADSESLVNELASYDDESKAVSSPSIFDNATPNPNVELETVPFTPSWKLGSVESQMNVKNLSDAMAADFNQMADENAKSKGRTR